MPAAVEEPCCVWQKLQSRAVALRSAWFICARTPGDADDVVTVAELVGPEGRLLLVPSTAPRPLPVP